MKELQGDVMRIQAYSFDEVAKDIQEAISQGYELDLESNENFPLVIATLFTLGMKKKEKEKEVKVVQQEVARVDSEDKVIKGKSIEDKASKDKSIEDKVSQSTKRKYNKNQVAE